MKTIIHGLSGVLKNTVFKGAARKKQKYKLSRCFAVLSGLATRAKPEDKKIKKKRKKPQNTAGLATWIIQKVQADRCE